MSEQERKRQTKDKQRKTEEGNTAASLCGQGQVYKVSKHKPVSIKAISRFGKAIQLYFRLLRSNCRSQWKGALGSPTEKSIRHK